MSRLLDDLSSLAGRRNKAIPHYNLGLTSLGNKNYPSAINYFIRALKEDDTGEMHPIIRPNLGQAYLMNKEYEKAIDQLVKASLLKNTNNGSAFIHANLAYAYSELNNYGLAIIEYKKSLKFRPDDPKVHYVLGLLYDSKFQSDLALIELEKALQIEPQNQLYVDAYNKVQETPMLSFKIGRLTSALLTLGIIVVPSYSEKNKQFYPMIVYIYPESPLKRLAKEGDYITYVDGFEDGKGLVELLDVPSGAKLGLAINSARTVITAIPKIARKLTNQEKIQLYNTWFHTFDERVLKILEMIDGQEKDDIGAKWGYEFESLMRSWSAYKDDPLFEFAFSLLMEFFHAYTYSGSLDVNYEINLAKLNFKSINISLINFFKEINFNETAKYLENKILNPESKKNKLSITRKIT